MDRETVSTDRQVSPLTSLDIEWVQGIRPGLLGEIVRWHGLYYVRTLGWVPEFEALCAEQLGELAKCVGVRDDISVFSAWDRSEFLAGLVLDARPGPRLGARLRFFITSDKARGRGIGGELLRRALVWSDDRDYACVWLTTVLGLAASAHLYLKFGFTLVETHVDRTWGSEHHEQVWERRTHDGI